MKTNLQEGEIMYEVVTKAVGKDPRRTFHIYDNGETARTFELAETTDPGSGKKETNEVWRERQELVKFPHHILKNQHYVEARNEWIEKHKKYTEPVREGSSKCRVCDGKIMIMRSVFMNDEEQIQDTHLFKECEDCRRKELIARSEKKVPYDELPPKPKED